MSNPIYALILAGGSGERFWPLSRRARPKQLLRLVSEETLLEETVARLDGLVPRERILILTNVEQEAAVRELLPNLPKENIVAEPAKRDTAAAVALGAGWVAVARSFRHDDRAAGRSRHQRHGGIPKNVATAAAAAEETGALVTIGVKPTWACPGFGYIEQGEAVRLPKCCAGRLRNSSRRAFPRETECGSGRIFLRKGNFRWNAGMFVWSVPIRAERIQPARAGAGELHLASSRARIISKRLCSERFSKLPKISFDYAIMEKADRVLVVEATFDWDDVGSWRRWRSISKATRMATRPTATSLTLDSTNNIVFDADGTNIALLGVHNLIVVRTRTRFLFAIAIRRRRSRTLSANFREELQ